ncbi:hypothetical protein E2562_001179 [Oryza meyeriana var. granulata]|uniref:Uncharacterized protein n=1 Tax=Oryza meyeriana var. granulata TaxID=110450 RepID=A0A6G1DAX5_9ORYZ|nr:hypothetical protein E2562_001179 [Oryza meyeriana var. granulata]
MRGACGQGRPSSCEGSAVAGALPPVIVMVSSRESQYGSTDWQIDYRVASLALQSAGYLDLTYGCKVRHK